MSIQTEIALLQNTKDEIRTAIMEKGVIVYNNDPFSIYPTRIGQISTTAGDRDALFTDILERDITSIEIPEGTSRIDEAVFRYCTQMTTVVIPSTVTFIGYLAFEYCTSLTSITCLGTTPATLGGGSFYNTNDCPIYVPSDSVDTYKTAWPQYASRIQAIQQSQYFVRVNSYSDFVFDTPILIVNENNNTALDCSQILNTTSATTGLNRANNRAKSITIDANGKILADQTTLSYAGKIGATSAGYCLYYETNNTKHYIGINSTGYGYDTTTAPSYTENIYGGTDAGVSYMVVYGNFDSFIGNNNNFAVNSSSTTNWDNHTPGMAIYILQ